MLPLCVVVAAGNGTESNADVVAGRTSSCDMTVPVAAFQVVTRVAEESLRDLWFFTVAANVLFFFSEWWPLMFSLETRVFSAPPQNEQWPLLYMNHLLSAVLLCFLRVVEVCCAVGRFWILSISNLWSPSQFSSF